jgi:tetratricopeptide (TPR) repeat protein
MATRGRSRKAQRAAAVALALAAWAGGSWAQPANVTREETALLPAYCPYTQGSPGYLTEGSQKWIAAYGDTFHAMHHYCWSFVYLMRADRHSIPEQIRNFFLSQAFADIEYVVRHASPTHVLLPELLTKQGMITRRLKEPKRAMTYLNDAIALNPKYWRAYSELAECHLALNQKERALQVIEQGLAQVPESKVLNAMLHELRGAKRPAPARPPAPVPATRPPLGSAETTNAGERQ